MAGRKGRSGRKPKSAALHIADGTHRPDRHGPADGVSPVSCEVSKPLFGCPYAEQFWGEYVQPLIDCKLVLATDTSMLQSASEFWGLYRITYQILESDPTDKDARIAAATYWSKYQVAWDEFRRKASRRQEKPKAPGIAPRKRG